MSTMTLRRSKRRQSSPASTSVSRLRCQPLPHSIEALDLSTASSKQKLASIRFLVLSYLADIEAQLAQLESPDVESWKATGEFTIGEAKHCIRTALDMLQSIRHDVCSHFPELHLAEGFRSHLPDLSDAPSMPDVRAHFPDMPNVRSHLSNVRSRLPSFDLSEVRSRLDDVRTRFHDIDFRKPLSYIPILSDRINNLHSLLSSMELPSGLEFPSLANSMLSDLLDNPLLSDLADTEPSGSKSRPDDMIERAAKEVANAMKRSLEGVCLIKYTDLPEKWRNNPFVVQGYRFIPIYRWELIILSLFALHNETLNIHTHLIPFIVWSINCIPFVNPSSLIDTPETLFMIFALLCLFCSTLWHTMAGCAHSASMEFCARVDYVGIGWLISASVGTVVYYGFQCHPVLLNTFLLLCALTGTAGSIFPFMKWFNEAEYRKSYRILFFLSLAFSSIAPLAIMAQLHSTREMLTFIGESSNTTLPSSNLSSLAPVVPSLMSYITGLLFYVFHIPERWLPKSWCSKLDVIGGGSHCIWHCLIVLGMSQHKLAIRMMKGGMQCTDVHIT